MPVPASASRTPPSSKTRATAAAISTWPARGSKSGIARASGPPGAKTARVQRAGAVAQLGYASGYSGNFRHSASTSARTIAERAVVVRRLQRAREQLADDVHLGFAHAARRHRRRADADAARDHRRILIERNRVLVDRDARLAERRLRDLAGDALREDVDEHQVVVGAAADEAEAGGRSARRRAAVALATICCW